uniref:TIMELESS_C domain-containing protein n=1 Tax=Wuchereria bancrofti TaxID=6293 RepID=A0A1I8EUX4_WUCBA
MINLHCLYIFLLADFESNTFEVNKAVLKLLHRVAFDLKMASRLYQLSLFVIFKRLSQRFKHQSISEIKKTQYFELYQFGYHILRRFYADYRKIGSKLIPELLFWKGPKECYEIDNGYGTFEIKPDGSKGKEILWPEELDNELRALYDEYLLFEEKPEGVDIVEYIEQGLSRPRTRRQIIRQMKMLGLNTFGARGMRRYMERRMKSSVFTPEIVNQMHNLIDEFNSKTPSSRPDLVNFIRSNLTEKYTRAKIIKQLQYENIHYEQPPRKRYSKAPQKLIEQRESGKEEIDQLLEGSDMLGFDHSRQRNDEYGKRLIVSFIFRELNKTNKSITCFSPEDDLKSADGIISSDIFEYVSPRSNGNMGVDELLTTCETNSVITNNSDDEVILGKRERPMVVSDEDDNNTTSKKTRTKRIIESDSE